MTEAEYTLEAKLWKALKDDRIVMLGLADGDDGHSQPMSAQTCTTKTRAARSGSSPRRKRTWCALSARRIAPRCTFRRRGIELFASVQGELTPATIAPIIDQLWNRFVAAWYEGGKDDPKLQLLRFDPSMRTCGSTRSTCSRA